MAFPNAHIIRSFPKEIEIDMNRTRGMGKTAVYTLVAMKDSEAFVKAVMFDPDTAGDSEGPVAALAPIFDFSNSSFDDLVRYHIDLCSRDESWDYSNIIVGIHENYVQHGVLVACMIDQDYNGRNVVPMLGRAYLEDLPADAIDSISALSWCINFQVANMDIYELKEAEESISWLEPIPGYEALMEELKISGEKLKAKAQDEYSRLATRHERYLVHHIADYDRDTGTMAYDIEPDIYYKEITERENKISTTPGLSVFPHDVKKRSIEQLWEEIRKTHPASCGRAHGRGDSSWRANKFWMFVYDKTAASNEGVALVRLIWDGNVSGKSQKELDAIMPQVEIVDRQPYNNALDRMDGLSEFVGAL